MNHAILADNGAKRHLERRKVAFGTLSTPWFSGLRSQTGTTL